MKEGLILITNPNYSKERRKALADEGFQVQVCTHPDEVERALHKFFPAWIQVPSAKLAKEGGETHGR